MPRPSKIVSVTSREVLDSRGNPTVEAEVLTTIASGRASVPSGASTGSHESLELRDGDPNRFHGKGVSKAVYNVAHVLGPRLRDIDPADQRRIDEVMIRLDGTPNKGNLGANAMLAVSMAAARAAANGDGVSLFEKLRGGTSYTLPVPMMNVINGGEHAGNNLAVQEFLIEPVDADSCSEAIRVGSEVYQSLKTVLVEKYGRSAINVGDEGGFAPPLKSTRDALRAIWEAISQSGHAEAEVRLGIDAAASEFFDEKTGRYNIDGKSMGHDALEDFYSSLRDEFGLLTLEDPFDEEAFDSFSSITKRLGARTKVIGDDIYVTNVQRIKKGIQAKATNAVLIKLNQVGTVSETEDAVELTRGAGWTVVVSHRSGETEDPFIAHLATAFGSEFIKTGAPARGERIAKYNELLRIEEELGPRAKYAGKNL
ncbi:MAG: phosphopyruvate hydratase [Nitrososphaerota archaeon]|jgi:enolase|nr:phosphopyruvate hydratase [Nitrososphaerota archaeon]MDG6942844.1 phosphopyruvate hydratase [Nitrososphaerota archaeon]MDG6950836.1 phosphopyruvate hydratase [Nitrososphaerota archaeon]